MAECLRKKYSDQSERKRNFRSKGLKKARANSRAREKESELVGGISVVCVVDGSFEKRSRGEGRGGRLLVLERERS